MKLRIKWVFLFTSICFLMGTTLSFATEKNHYWKPKVEKIVSVLGAKIHQGILQKIADNNDGNRAAGTKGYDMSAKHVEFMLKISGYDVERQDFDFPYFDEISDPEFDQVTPLAQGYPANDENGFFTMTYSGAGDVTGPIQAVDVVLPPGTEPNTSTSGCEAEDFRDFIDGNIALIQRGSCSFSLKAENAMNAGASAVIMFNEGQEGRTAAIGGTLQNPDFDIPIIFTTFAIGDELNTANQAKGLFVHVMTDTLSEIKTSHNIIASTKGGDPANTIIAGAHLDSVLTAPGINDNGSGSAAILETAMKMAWMPVKPKNKVKFAFFGAEELGLIGSEAYVAKLTPEELSDIKLYLNFDMIGSPNYVRFVFDGDGSDTEIAGPEGSGEIEQFFVDYFADQDMQTDPAIMDGRSDYASFMNVGIPVGGLFTGAGGLKTEEQAAIYGGTVGEPYDANYHTPEDNMDNVNWEAEKQMLKAIAASIDHYSMKDFDTQTVSRAFSTSTTEAATKTELEYKGPYLVK
ncbi:MAG: M20/M25/M40 family metallo-hydrolase [Desulfobacteraceae bacterium]|nr:M20/M25/M40 family metallo-hydrolase [Desulfobacteraceae bacterium]